MEIKQPLVSVLMTAYNREDYIAEAIESVLASTYTNFELIIVDDRSKDNTVSIAQNYQKIDGRIKVHINEKNLGDYANRNKAAEYAKGKYIKYLDSDDTIYDWGLEYCVENIERFPGAGMGIFQTNRKVQGEYLVPNDAVNKHFFQTSFLNIGPSGTILKTKEFIDAGKFRAEYGPASDLYFNLKMASLYPIVMLKKEFFFYREHDGQEIKNSDAYLYFNYPVIRDLLKNEHIPVSIDCKAKLLSNARKKLLRQCLGDIKNTRRIVPAYKALKLSGLSFGQLIKTVIS